MMHKENIRYIALWLSQHVDNNTKPEIRKYKEKHCIKKYDWVSWLVGQSSLSNFMNAGPKAFLLFSFTEKADRREEGG